MVLMQLFNLKTLNKLKIVQVNQSGSKYWYRLAKVLTFVQWYDSLLLNYAHSMTEINHLGSVIDMNMLKMPHQLFH
jgi:hypothetical protein